MLAPSRASGSRAVGVGVVGVVAAGLAAAAPASEAGRPCPIEPGPEWILEGEACDDSGAPDVVNGGCGSDPPVHSPLACGDDVFGLAWAVGGLRDIDWYEIVAPADGPALTVDVSLSSEHPARLFRFVVDPTCFDVPSGFVEVARCGTGSLVVALPPGARTWFVVEPTMFDGLPCNEDGDGSAYHLAVGCSPSSACPADLDGDGVVRFTDLLVLLDHWGDCPRPGSPCPGDGDIDGDGTIDFDDLLTLLGGFGPCPAGG